MIVGAEGVKAFQGQAIAGRVKTEQYNMISETISTAIKKGMQASKPGGGVELGSGKMWGRLREKRDVREQGEDDPVAPQRTNAPNKVLQGGEDPMYMPFNARRDWAPRVE